MRKSLTMIGMMTLLLLAVALASPAAATPNVCRGIPSGNQPAGTDIPVTLDVTVDDAGWYLIDETIPTGLTVTDAGGASTTTPGHLKWSVASGATDTTYTYKVQGSAGAYTFSGEYLMQGMSTEAPIDCDTGLVITAPPAGANVCRGIPSGNQPAGTDIPVTLDVTVDDAGWYLIDETIPTGLTVTDAGGASTTTPGHLKWSVASGATDTTYTYKVQGSAGAYTFSGEYLMQGMSTEAPIDCDTGLVITAPPAGANVCRGIPSGNQPAGTDIPVTLDVTVDGAGWYLIDETIPTGLTVTDAGGASTTTPGHLKWSVASGATDTTYTYKVQGSAGAYTFSGEYLMQGMSTEAPIDCDTGLVITAPPAGANVCRGIPSGNQPAGTDIPVTLDVTVDDAGWYLIDETIPTGLTVTDAGGASTTTPGHLKWSVASGATDTTYTYKVQGSAGAYTFSGEYLMQGMSTEAPIDCDTGLVITAPPAGANVCRGIPSGNQPAGTDIPVTLDVTVDDAGWYLIDETIPTGLTVTDAGGASTTTPGHLKWSVASGATDTTYTYKVQGSAGAYTFSGEYLMQGMSTEAPIDCDTGLVITAPPAGANVCRGIPSGNQPAGTDIPVTLDVTVDGAGWYLIDETIPTGLTVTDAGGASTTTPGHLKWSVASGATDTTYTYKVQGSAGAYTFSGEYLMQGMSTEAPIDCDTGLEIEETDDPPEPSITSPADGSIVSGTAVPVVAVDDSNEGDIAYALFEYYNDSNCNCEADDGNTWVEIYNDTSSTSGWSAVWNTTPIPDCCHLIRVTMADGTDQNGSAQINVVVSNHAPVPNITAPGNGDVLNRSVVINAVDESFELGADIAYTRFEYYNDSNCNCEADDGNTWVEIGNDTDGTDGWSAEWDTLIDGVAAYPNGCYMIRATMGDMHGRTGSDEINVDLSNPDFCLDLKTGWNLVSIPKRINGSNAANDVFSLTAGESCMHYDGCADGWLSNGAVQVVPCQGYWVYKIADETVCVYFDPGTGSVSPPTENLCTGWNMIGHIDTSLMPVDDGTSADFGSITTIEGKFAQIWQWTPDHGWECYPLGGFAFMTPGQGYWILMTDNATMSGTL